MVAQENKKDHLLQKCNELLKCSVSNVDDDGDDGDEDDTDYIPSVTEEQEAIKETNYVDSLREDSTMIERRTLDEKVVKEIDDLWEEMKAQSNILKSSCANETTNLTKNGSNDDFFNINNEICSSSTSVSVPQKRKRSSAMDEIIKKYSTSRRESTLTKSKKLWHDFRQEENIGDELDVLSKNSQIDKVSFLNQAKYKEWKLAQAYRLRDIFRKQNRP